MNFPSNSNSKTTFKNFFQQPSNQHPQTQQRQNNQTYQGNFYQAPANSTIFHNHNINKIYESFLEKREDIKQKISQAFPIFDIKAREAEVRGLIFQKPVLQEALDLQSFIDNTLFSLHKEEIQEDIEQSKACLKKVQGVFIDYQAQLSDWKSPVDPNQMIEIAGSIASAWDQIYQLSFYDPCLIQEICDIEWLFRAKEVLSHERTDSEYPYVDHCKDLQKAARESQSEKIKGSFLYKRVEEELTKSQRLMANVRVIKEDSKKEEIQGLMQELKEFGFGMKEEIEFLEKISQKVSSQTQTQKKVGEPTHDKNSIVQVKLEDFMDSVLQDISRFDETRDSSQKSQEEKLRNEAARSILVANKELLARLAIDMTASQPNGEVQKISAFAEKLIKNLQEHPPKFEDIFVWSEQIKEFKLYAKEFEQIKVELCLSKVKFIQVFCETLAKPIKKIPLQELSKLLVEIKGYYLQGFLEGTKKEILKEHMMYLKDLMKKVKAQVHTEVDLQRENEWRPPNIMFYNFIDISEEIDHLKKEFENKKKINQKMLQNGHLESLNKKRSSTSPPEEEQEEEINLYNPLVKKLKGETNYKTVNRTNESFDTTAETRKRSEKNVNKLVEEIVGDTRKKNNKKTTEKRNEREEDEFVIKKKGTKKHLNGGCEDPWLNCEIIDSPTEIEKELAGDILVEEIIGHTRNQEKNFQKGTDNRKENKFIIKKYLNECDGETLSNFEQSNSSTESQKELGKRDKISMLVEEIIGDTRKRDNNDKKLIRNGRKEEEFVVKQKETKKYFNEDCLLNIEQSPVRQYDLDKINDFLLHIDDGFKLKKKNKNETRVDSKDGISKIN